MELLLQTIKAGATWEEYLARLHGRYYKDQVKLAVNKFKKAEPDLFKFTTNDEGFKRWLNEN